MLKCIDIASYADDSTPLNVEKNIDVVIASLEQVSDASFNCHECHVLVSTKEPAVNST